jgi:hypothetical protein
LPEAFAPGRSGKGRIPTRLLIPATYGDQDFFRTLSAFRKDISVSPALVSSVPNDVTILHRANQEDI